MKLEKTIGLLFIFCIFLIFGSFAWSLEDVSPPIDNANPNYLPGSDATTSLKTVSQTNVQLMAQVSQLSQKIDNLSAVNEKQLSDFKQAINADFEARTAKLMAYLIVILIVFIIFFWSSFFIIKARGWF